ncbi:SpaA isopeptide-forming pilin-related protein [Schaalia sp. JY-X169]|uniref:SpaA isopeptide-forming pilin-related protein n=1 Tax=Schaalia sp. JY-X169 TaxID=2758572 RepID=UPI0015F71938|nr:SpaA isopeptide-forming pilin-related protein [Schaalia sp. JY-X169]
MARRAGPKHSTSVEETYARGRMGALAALATLALVGTGAAGAFAATTIPQSDATSEDATPAVAMVADDADTPAVITEEPADEVPNEGTTPVTPADPAPAPAPVPEVTTPTDTTAPTPTEPSKPAGEVSTTTDQPQTDTTSADEAEAQSLEAGIRPLTAGPESTVDPPYIYWDVRDTSNNLVQGASVRIAGPRSSSSNWGDTITVLDNYGQAGYTGADLDPDRGEFLVKQIGSHNITSSRRYRIQRGDAPYGYTWSTNNNWIEMSSSATWTNQTYDFGNLTLNKATTSNYTITVPKGTYRTGTASNAVNGTDTAGVRFGIFASQTATEPIHTCEITTANPGNCVFTNVALVQSQQVFVRELPPAAGSTAAQKLVPILTNFSTGDSPFMNQTYQYGFTPASTSTISIPTTSTDNGTNWTQPPYDAGSGYFANRVVNPRLTQTCNAGVKVAVVLDTSGSVNNYQNTLAQATTALVDGLTGTPSSVAMFSFAANSPGAVQNHPTPQSVETPAGANIVKGWYSTAGSNGQTANFTPSGGTNWDDGLWKTAQGALSNNYDIVFVLTDGNPTFSNNGRDRSGSGSMTTFRELERAVFSANAVKATDTRVVTVGIGGNLSDDNLAAISGPTKFATGMGLNEFDYAVANWSELQGVLENFAQGLKCEATVTVEKLAKAASAENFTPASGWTFDFAQTGADSQTPVTTEGTTSTDGKYTWTLKFTNPTDTSDATLTEQSKPGWALEDIACTVNDANITLDELKAEVPGIGIGENVVCTFKNREVPKGTLTLVKAVTNPSGGLVTPFAMPQDWDLTATSTATGNTKVIDAKKSGSTGATNIQVDPGSYTLSEAFASSTTGPSGDVYGQDGDWVCTGSGGGVTGGDTVTVANGENVTCTVTNATAELTVLKKADGPEAWATAGDWTVSATSGTLPGLNAATGSNSATADNSILVKPGANYMVTEALASGQNPQYTQTAFQKYVVKDGCPAAPINFDDTCWTTDGVDAASVSVEKGERGIYRFVNVPKQTLNLVKVVNNSYSGNLTPESWDGDLFAQKGNDTKLVFDSGETQDVASGNYVLTEAPKDGYEQESLVCEGGTLEDSTVTVDAGASVTCTFTNKDKPGTVTWEKVDSVNTSTFLAGSEWTIVGPNHTAGTVIQDCTSGTCAELDKDPAAGKFKLEGLHWGTYTVTETKAPPGYVLNSPSNSFTFTIDGLNAGNTVTDKGSPFLNHKAEGPKLPLTGGQSAAMFTILGGGLLAGALALTAMNRRKGGAAHRA